MYENGEMVVVERERRTGGGTLTAGDFMSGTRAAAAY